MEADPTKKEQKPAGARLLELIGYEHLLGMDTGHVYKDGPKRGQPVLTDNFDVLSGPHIAMMVTALERTPLSDPKHQRYVDAARSACQAHFPQAFEEQIG